MLKVGSDGAEARKVSLSLYPLSSNLESPNQEKRDELHSETI